jgi:hypothetical protein
MAAECLLARREPLDARVAHAMLDAEPANVNGPAADVRASVEYLKGVLAA